MLLDALDILADCTAHPDAEAMGAAFYARLEPLGARSVYARAYGSDSAGHRAPSQTFYRVSPPGWEDVYDREAADSWNPIARAASLRLRPFRFREVPTSETRMDVLWAFLESFGITDGIAVPCHGHGGKVGLFSIAFQDVDGISPRERAAIELSALALHGMMRDTRSGDDDPAPPRLTPREHDCIAYVAEGKSDWEIGVILGISKSTAHQHVESAKRKLGAATRAQAVARWILSL